MFVLALYPEISNIEVDTGSVQFLPMNQEPNEQFILGALCRLREPRLIFEIGTFNGSTTILMARNAPGAEIFEKQVLSADDALARLRIFDYDLRWGGHGIRHESVPLGTDSLGLVERVSLGAVRTRQAPPRRGR